MLPIKYMTDSLDISCQQYMSSSGKKHVADSVMLICVSVSCMCSFDVGNVYPYIYIYMCLCLYLFVISFCISYIYG